MAAFFGRIGGWLYHQPYLLIAITYLTWALNIVLGRHISGTLPPVTLSIWRWALAALIVLPFAWPHLKRDWPAIRDNAAFIAVLSVAGTTGYSVLSYWGLQYTQAINGILIQCTLPLVVGVMSFLLLGDRLTSRQIAGSVVSLVGVFIILMRGSPDVLHSFSFNRGDIWFVGATLVLAIYSALVKKRPAMHPLSLLATTLIVGTALMLPLYFWEISVVGTPHITTDAILVVLYVAIFPSIIAYLCYNRAVQLIGPNRVAAAYPLVVVFGATMSFLLLGEQPQLFHLIGSVLIVGGVWLATRQSRVTVPSKA